MQETKIAGQGAVAAYAVPSDFCHLFSEEMNSLYLLAFLLTADEQMAEQCFASALKDCQKANGVFRNWARTWARRMIIQNAIRMMQVRPGVSGHEAHAPLARTGAAPTLSDAAPISVGGVPFVLPIDVPRWPLEAVSELSTFERFAFVMSVLESYSDQECRVLLGCLRQEVADARSRALEMLGKLADAAEFATERKYRTAAAQSATAEFFPFENAGTVESRKFRST